MVVAVETVEVTEEEIEAATGAINEAAAEILNLKDSK